MVLQWDQFFFSKWYPYNLNVSFWTRQNHTCGTVFGHRRVKARREEWGMGQHRSNSWIGLRRHVSHEDMALVRWRQNRHNQKMVGKKKVEYIFTIPNYYAMGLFNWTFLKEQQNFWIWRQWTKRPVDGALLTMCLSIQECYNANCG